MVDVRIRRAGADDALVVAALHLQFARELGMQSEPGYLDRFAEFWLAERPDRPTWIAECRSEHAGVLATRRIRPLPLPGRPDASWLYLNTHFVAPDHRQRGVGQALTESLLTWARSSDVAWIRVNATGASARAFYGRFGFASPDRLMEIDLRERP
ncbi:MAG: GNAT family N-acetyltransferase [Micrococcales bacterium]|nr:GNAT family N-acetyltransferase [Micrococcales bacterium]